MLGNKGEESGSFVVRISRLGEQGEYGIEEVIIPPFEPVPGSERALSAAIEEVCEKICSMNISVNDLKGKRIEDPRKGQIALAAVRNMVIKDGIRLHPQNLRSGIGNKVKELNEIDPELKLTTEEAREFARELVDYAVEATFGPSDYDVTKDYLNR
jgi:hypothetical protein